jgi:4-amino-4-deoxy-L-arabinose transferase-like glycosyltransferase
MTRGVARAARLVCWAAALAVVVWAARSLRFRDGEGALTGAICLPIACGIAVAVAGAGFGSRYQRFACWVSVALAGQAVALQTIDAGRRLHYQHFQPLALVWQTRPWLLLWIVAQTVVVAVAFGSRARALRASMRGSIRAWQLALAAVLSLSTAATVSASASRYVSELAFAVFVQLLGIATIVVVALEFPADALGGIARRWDRVVGPADTSSSEPPRAFAPDWVAWSAAAFVAVVAALLSIYSYQRHPHVEDEVADLIQARYMARGMLAMPAPPVPAAFDVEQMYFEPTRWWSPVPPGWPATLAIGVAAGVPWLVNPVLGGVSIVLAFLVLLDVYGRRIARLGVLLLAVSPWYVFLAMSFMTHASTLTFALLAAVGVIAARRTGRPVWGLLAGCALGVLVAIRPLDAVVAGGCLTLWALGIGGTRLKAPAIAAFIAATAAVGSLTLFYNAYLTGDPWNFPINAYFDKYWAPHSNAYGFGADRGAGWPIDPNPGHGPLDGVINANLNTFMINVDLFGWSTGSLVFLAIVLCSRSLARSDRLMIATMGAVFIAYFFYWFSGGPDYGARYWFLMIVPIVALTARGIEWLMRTAAGARVAVAALVLSALAVVNYFPWRAIDKYYHYLGMRPDVRDLAKQHGFDGALVLVRGRRGPDYSSAAVENPVDLTDHAPVYVWDRDPATRAAVLRAFPSRPVWIIEGPSVTASGYRIVEGPVAAADLLAERPGTR